jgi:hypothetical protein
LVIGDPFGHAAERLFSAAWPFSFGGHSEVLLHLLKILRREAPTILEPSRLFQPSSHEGIDHAVPRDTGFSGNIGDG